MGNEEFVFVYKYDYYVYRKDSSGEYVILLKKSEEDGYLYIWNAHVSYTELLDERDSWDIREEYKKGWVFPQTCDSSYPWLFSLCYYDSSFEDTRVFTRWEDLMPWVMKLALLSSDTQILVEYLGVFHNDHGRVEFTDHSIRRQFVGDMVDELLLEGGM